MKYCRVFDYYLELWGPQIWWPGCRERLGVLSYWWKPCDHWPDTPANCRSSGSAWGSPVEVTEGLDMFRLQITIITHHQTSLQLRTFMNIQSIFLIQTEYLNKKITWTEVCSITVRQIDNIKPFIKTSKNCFPLFNAFSCCFLVNCWNYFLSDLITTSLSITLIL